MSDIYFALKMLGLTVVLVFLMQIKIGSTTVEQRSLGFIRSSTAVETLNGVAQGAIKAIVQGSRWVSAAFDTNVGKVFRSGQQPGSRLEMFHFKRSETVERQQTQKAAEAASGESLENEKSVSIK